MKTKRLPTIKALSALLKALKPLIMDDHLQEEGDTVPSMQVTIGWTPKDGTWNYQTGDTSFTGGAYGHPVWASCYLQRRSDTRELARDLIYELDEGAVCGEESFPWDELTVQAQQVALCMIDYCLTRDLCMGMDGGFNKQNRPRSFRSALEHFVASNQE